MKICMLGETGSVHLECIAAGLASRGHFVRVITSKPVRMQGVTVERFAVPRLGWRYPGRWRSRWNKYLRRIMRSHDVVHVQFLHDWGLTPQIAAEGCLFATPWGADVLTPPGVKEPSAEVTAKRRELLRMARCVVFFGGPFARVIAKFAGLDTSQIEIVPLGVDTERFSPRPKTTSEPPRVGYFKGYAPVYDPETMIDAIARVHERLPEARFDFVGSGVRREMRRRYAVEKGVDRLIRWIDRQPHEKLPAVMGEWDLVAISSVNESYGLAALESSAMELPVVATDVCGLTETVQHEVSGLRVPPRDSRAMADAIVSLLGDPSRRREMGRRGRQMVIDHFEQNRCLDQLIDLYERTLASAAAQRVMRKPGGGSTERIAGGLPISESLRAMR